MEYLGRSRYAQKVSRFEQQANLVRGDIKDAPSVYPQTQYSAPTSCMMSIGMFMKSFRPPRLPRTSLERDFVVLFSHSEAVALVRVGAMSLRER